MGNALQYARCADGGKVDVSSPPITAVPPEEKSQEEPVSNNPGDYEEIGKKAKEQVLPQAFDGCKVVFQKGLSQNFQTMHTLTLGSTTTPSQWQFGATYVGSKKISEREARPVLIGDVSSNGSFTALILHRLGQAWRLKVNMQTQLSRWVGYQGSLDYVGSDFTFSSTLANPDVVSGTGVAVLQYLQSITSRLSLGSEVLLQKGGGMETSLLSVGGAYKTDTWETSAKLGLHSWYVSYLHKLQDLSFIADCEGSLMQGESVASIGYRMDINSFTMKAKLDSQGTVAAVFEKRLDPLPATLSVSGIVNHWTDDTKFGVGFMIG